MIGGAGIMAAKGCLEAIFEGDEIATIVAVLFTIISIPGFCLGLFVGWYFF